MHLVRLAGAAVVLLGGCHEDRASGPPNPSALQPADPFLAGLKFNKAREQLTQADGARVSIWTDGSSFGPPSYIDLYIDMTAFTDWEKLEAMVRVKASCPTIGGARQTFEKEYQWAD